MVGGIYIHKSHYALDTCLSIRTASTCLDMDIIKVCRISTKKLVDYQQFLRPINRTLVSLKRARVS